MPAPSTARVFVRCLVVLIALTVSACASLRPNFESPTVTISSFKPVPSSGAMPSFEIGLRVVNPNPTPLALRGVSYNIELGGRELISGVGKDLPVIDGYGEGVFTVTASASLFEGLRFLNDLMSSPTDLIDYQLETKLDVGGFLPAIRVRDAGEISLAP